MSWSTLYNLYCIHLFSSSALRDLGDDRDGEEFTNVTLAYEDGWQAEAHKVVLALSIPFIKCLPKQNMHHHPLIMNR